MTGDPSSLDGVATVDQKSKRFRNPGGPVGLSGRGLIGHYGPNHATDLIVTRVHHKGGCRSCWFVAATRTSWPSREVWSTRARR